MLNHFEQIIEEILQYQNIAFQNIYKEFFCNQNTSYSRANRGAVMVDS